MERDPGPTRRTSREAVDRIVQRVLAGLAAFYALVSLGWVGAVADRPFAATALVLGTACLAAVAVRGLLGRIGTADVVAVLMSLAFSIVPTLAAPDTGIGLGIQGTPSYLFVTMSVLLLCLRLRPARALPLTVLPISVYVACRTLDDGAAGLTTALDETVSDLAVILAAGLVLETLRRAARRADTARERREQQTRTIARDQAVRDLAHERRRVLHDEVIAALVTIEHATGADGTSGVRRAAVDALAALDGRPPVAVGPGLSAVSGAPVPVDLRVVSGRRERSRALVVPHAVDVAIDAATREALRNVARHAGVDRASVVVRETDEPGVEVVISDEGRGFDVDEATGFGLRQSITARMTEVGGQATIESSPGRGTRVRLTWTPRNPPPSFRLADLRATIGDPWRLVGPVTAIGLVGQLWLLARHLPTGGDLAEALVAVACTAWVLAVAAWSATRPMGRTASTGLVAVTCALLWSVYTTAGDGAVLSFDGYGLNILSVLLFTCAFVVPTRWLLGLGAAMSLTVLAWVVHAGEAVGAASDPVLQPLFYAAAMGAVSAGARKVNEQADEDEARTAAEALAEAMLQERERAATSGADSAMASIVPFLEAVRDREVAVGEPDTTTRARALALRVRDELYLSDLLDDEVRATLAAARAAGIDMVVRAPVDDPPRVPVADLLRVAVDLDTTTRATLTLPRPTAPYARLVVVPGLSRQDRARVARVLARAEVTGDESSTVVTVPAGPARTDQSGR